MGDMRQDSNNENMVVDENSETNEMERLLHLLLKGQLQSIGLLREKTQKLIEYKTKYSIDDKYYRWLDESLSVLEKANIIAIDGEDCILVDAELVDMDLLWEEWEKKKAVWMEEPDIKSKMVLLDVSIRALPDVITGKLPATDVLFPRSSMALVEGIYKDNMVTDYFNDVLADMVVAFLEERIAKDPSVQVRIIEIGAGTGGTSAVIFQKIKPYCGNIKEYCYTDISKAFLMHAEKTYGPYNPYLTYKIFDAEAPAEGQQLDIGGYDIAIATNVLHATKNIRKTICNVKGVLKRNGLLLLNEMSCNSLFLHLTFGLLEGWWKYEDAELRIPGCPGILPETWRMILESEGFRSVFFPASQDHAFGHQIIAAESDGIINRGIPHLTQTADTTGIGLSGKVPVEAKHAPIHTETVTTDKLREKCIEYLKELIGDTLGIPGYKLEPGEYLEKYGMDSILAVRVTDELRKNMEDITGTLLFEYQTIDRLADYLVKNQKEALIKLFGMDEQYVEKPVTDNEVHAGMKYNCERYSNRRISDNHDNLNCLPDKERSLKPIDTDRLREKSTEYLKKLIGDTLGIPMHKIDSSDYLEKYGLDSILAVQVTDALKQGLDNITSTLLFEYRTIDALVEHFIETQRDSFIKLVGLEEQTTGMEYLQVYEASSVQSAEQNNTCAYGKEENMRHRHTAVENPHNQVMRDEDIAVIGISIRYPQSESMRELWENLKSGKDCITEIPGERWDYTRYYSKDKSSPDKTRCKWGGFIKDIDCFDPLFFNISPREAGILDPQVRIFMECVWNLFEGIGYTRETLDKMYQGRVGVFTGAMYKDYNLLDSDIVSESAVLVSTNCSIANRISYFFDLHGPSMAVDTACSSSAAAIHMACESLKRGECKAAVAGGVNLLIHPKKYLGFSLANLSGSSSERRSFADGDGFMPGEGVGAVLLKPLSDALEHKDNILAVIKSTAINHGGHASGYTAPNPNAEVELFEENFRKSGIHPRTISYVEAAANGSSLGDAIEVASLTKAFRKYTGDSEFCSIGSVKSNVGHSEGASTICQLAKVILQMQHKTLLPTIKADPLNPNINFTGTPFYLQRELQEWKRPVLNIEGQEREYPRRATISSFGGGTYVHIIVEEYVPNEKDTDATYLKTGQQIVVLSARNKTRLQEMVERLLEFLRMEKELNLKDIAYTLQIGREAMECRLAIIVNTLEELCGALDEFLRWCNEGGKLETAIPFFTGNLNEEKSELKDFLTGKLGDTVVKMLIEEKDLQKIALYWVQGGKIPWDVFNAGNMARRIFLPTYPFERRSCWVGSKPQHEQFTVSHERLNNAVTPFNAEINVNEYIVGIISVLLGIQKEEIILDRPLIQYGFDSITLMQLFQQIQSIEGLSVDLSRLQECRTVQDIIDITDLTAEKTPVITQYSMRSPYSKSFAQFPELVHFNNIYDGRPVFWLHGGVGGVESYKGVAKKSSRPFYGIEARGWMTEREPLHGIQAMAAYYTHIIQTVQPEGPYDLGGYSLGGVLANEVARQLQEMGQSINTIVMLDAPCYSEEVSMGTSKRKAMLSAANLALTTSIPDVEKLAKVLISRDEVSYIQDDDVFLDQLVTLALSRGVTKTEKQLYKFIRQCMKVQLAFEIDRASVLPLIDPTNIMCYYFRNKSGVFYGFLEPYYDYSDTAEKDTYESKNYWEHWKSYYPNLYIMDVDSSNHLMMLTEPKAYEPIEEFCEKLYSREGMSQEFFNVFYKKQKYVKKTRKKSAKRNN